MTITYTDTIANVSAAQLGGFFGSWDRAPTPQVHLRLLAGSAARVLAIEEGSGQVVGYLGVALDARGQAYVPLLEVLPAYQGRGVAGELTRRMMAKLAPQLAREQANGEPLPRLARRAGA